MTRDGSYEQWQELAPRWEKARDLMWDSTYQVSEWLVERLDPQPGQTVLDLAAGTGETGFLAAPLLVPGGLLISADRSPNMLAAGRRGADARGLRNVDFRLLEAERLELPAATVDGVLCRFGYILKGDPPPALAEIRRVLRPGGRLAFSVWVERERNAWMTVPADVMVSRGHLHPQTDEERRTSEKRNPASINALLTAAGFDKSEIEEQEVAYRFADSDELWFFVSELRGPVAQALARLDEDERQAVRAEIESRATRTSGGGFALGGVSLNVATS
ncbi:MAG: methyltransferase domain-containing protein [Actinomycetes bacterium]